MGFLPPVAALNMEKVGAITVSANDQTIRDKVIVAGGSGVLNSGGYSGLTLERCLVLFNGDGGTAEACGVKTVGASGVTIRDCEFINIGAPDRGALPSANKQCVLISGGSNATISRVTTRRGADGVRLVGVNTSNVDHLENHDTRGPAPRGMAYQNASGTGTHTAYDMSCELIPGVSHSEDSFSIFKTPSVDARRIKIPIGTVGPSGRGFVIEGGESDNCSVDEAEFLWMYNGVLAAGATFGEDGVYPDGFSLSGIRTKHWNKYGPRGPAGSSAGTPTGYPPASFSMQAAIAGTYGIKYWDRGYTTTDTWNLSSAALNVTGSMTAEDWTEQLSVVRNALPWRSRRSPPSRDLDPSIGSYWLDGEFATALEDGAVLGLLPGRYKHDPTSRAWQWLRDGTPISGATGMNYSINWASDDGHRISCRETVANAAGSYVVETPPIEV